MICFAETKQTNGLAYTSSAKRLFQLIKCSSNPLSTVRELNEAGVLLACLNDHVGIGTLLCEVTIQTYGLGIKTLLKSGLNLSIEDTKTGDTPLLLVCAEGLCGPISKLLDQLPPSALLHRNQLGSTPLKLLLVRSHGHCGCLQKLLSHLPLCELLLPNGIATRFSSTDSLIGINYSMSTCAQCPSLATDHDDTRPDEAMFHTSHTVLMSISCLLNKIRSTDPDRILSVLQTWINGNLLFVHQACRVEHENNWNAVRTRLIDEVYRQVQEGKAGVGAFKSLLRTILQLTILNQLKATHVIEYSHSYAGVSESFFRLKEQFTRHIDGSVLPLRYLMIQRIRHILQIRFIQKCLQHGHQEAGQGYQQQGAMIFVQWINSLNCLPPFIRNTLLLGDAVGLPTI